MSTVPETERLSPVSIRFGTAERPFDPVCPRRGTRWNHREKGRKINLLGNGAIIISVLVCSVTTIGTVVVVVVVVCKKVQTPGRCFSEK